MPSPAYWRRLYFKPRSSTPKCITLPAKIIRLEPLISTARSLPSVPSHAIKTSESFVVTSPEAAGAKESSWVVGGANGWDTPATSDPEARQTYGGDGLPPAQVMMRRPPTTLAHLLLYTRRNTRLPPTSPEQARGTLVGDDRWTTVFLYYCAAVSLFLLITLFHYQYIPLYYLVSLDQ